jgi:hypothetical protein
MISSDRRELPVYRMPHPYDTPSKLETPLYWRIRESERHEELCKEIHLCSCDLKAVFSSSPSVMPSQADEHVPHGPSATVCKRNALYSRVSGVTQWWLAWYLFFFASHEASNSPTPLIPKELHQSYLNNFRPKLISKLSAVRISAKNRRRYPRDSKELPR